VILGMFQIDLFFWSDSVDVTIVFSRSIHKLYAEGMGRTSTTWICPVR
jgi:hypothetical protein